MRFQLIAAAAALTLTACGGGESQNSAEATLTANSAPSQPAEDTNTAMEAMDHNAMDPAAHEAMMGEMNGQEEGANLANGL